MDLEKVKEELTPKNDVIFRRLFSKQNKEKLLKDFLEAILKIKIERLELRKRNTIIARK